MYYDKMDINRNETQTVIKINNKRLTLCKKETTPYCDTSNKNFRGISRKMQTLKKSI